MSIDISKLSLAGQVNYKKVMEGIPIWHRFIELSKDPMKHNEEFLMQVIRDNKDTEYGKKYDFENIHTIEDFQKKVPITKYDDYAEYILRMTEDGEENLICAYPIKHYNKSSETMRNPKRLPMSEKALNIFDSYVMKCAYGLAGEKLGLDWIDAKTIALTESSATEEVLKCGATYGAVSAKAVRQFRPYLEMLFTSPDEAAFPLPDTNTRYLHALFSLMDSGVTNVTVSFFSFFLELLRYIEGNWEMLVNDMERGTIDASVKMSDAVRKSVESKMKPMPERAAQLREIFKQGFDTPFISKVWPRMKFIAGIGTGGFKLYADKIKEKYSGDQVAQLKLGISASEGTFTVPVDLNREDTALIPDSVFFEFLPLDADDDFSKIVTMDKLEIGKDYEIIITNCSGFYRYRMRDAIRVTGMFNNTPTVQFLFRIDQTVSIMGEKTTEIALRAAAENTAKELGFELIDFSMYPDMDATPARYLYFMEIGEKPKELKPKEIRHVLEQKLAEANPSMGDKVKKGICGATKLNFLEAETYMLYRDLMISKGTASGQLKPVRVINNELQRKFFFGLTEYGVEFVR